MKIRTEEIKDTEKDVAFVEEVSEINEALSRTGVVDYQFKGGAPVEVSYYRLGEDLLFRGHFTGSVVGTCARCLERYPFTLREPFTVLMKPSLASAQQQQLSEEDLSLSYYSGDEVDLSPLVREAMLLALPTRPLCREDCHGLCPRCGANWNVGECGCRNDPTDPRLDVLRTLKR